VTVLRFVDYIDVPAADVDARPSVIAD